MPHASFDDNLKWFFARPAQDGSHAGRVGVGDRDVLYEEMADRVRTEPDLCSGSGSCIMAGPNIHWGSGSTPHTKSQTWT